MTANKTRKSQLVSNFPEFNKMQWTGTSEQFVQLIWKEKAKKYPNGFFVIFFGSWSVHTQNGNSDYEEKREGNQSYRMRDRETIKLSGNRKHPKWILINY